MKLVIFTIILHVVATKHIPDVTVNHTLHLAYLLSWSHEWGVGYSIGSSIIIGIQEVRKRHLLDGYEITWSHRDTYCEPRHGLAMLIDIWDTSPDVDGIIGGDCSVVCHPTALLAAAWNIPSVSFGCSSKAFSNKTTYPTFSRTTGVYVDMAPMFVKVCQIFSWKRVGLITDIEELFHDSANGIKTILEENDIEVLYYTSVTSVKGKTINYDNLIKLRNILKVLRDTVRIIIVFLYPQDLRVIHIEAMNFGMLDGRYVFFGLDSANLVTDTDTPIYHPEIGLDILQGMLDTTPAGDSGPKWEEFQQKVIDEFDVPAFAHFDHLKPGDDISQVPSYAGNQVTGRMGLVLRAGKRYTVETH